MAPVKKPKPRLGPHFLRKWRDARGVSQQVAADAINVSRELLSKIEGLKSPYLQQHLEGLAALYRVSPGVLLTVDPEDPDPVVNSEAEVRRFVMRIKDFSDTDVDVVMSVISNAMAIKRAGSEPLGSHDQPEPSSRHHVKAP